MKKITQKEESETVKNKSKNNFLIVIAIAFFVMLFVVTLGLIQKAVRKDEEELEKKKVLTTIKRKEFYDELQSKKKKFKKLNRDFRVATFIARFITSFVIVITALYLKFSLDKTLEDIINLYQAFFFTVGLLMFLIHGNIKNISKSFKSFKKWIKSVVYRKHPNIKKEIKMLGRKVKKQKRKERKVDKQLQLNQGAEAISIPKVDTDKKLLQEKMKLNDIKNT